MRRLPIVLAAVLMTGCAANLPRYAPSPPSAETGFYEDRTTPQLALLEYRLAKYLAQGQRPYAVVCAAATRLGPQDAPVEAAALEPAVERNLMQRFPKLSPLDRCKRDERAVVASDTGVPAAIFDVHEFTCLPDGDCLGWAGYYAEGQHGWTYYRMTFDRGEWRIRREELDIQLTGSTPD